MLNAEDVAIQQTRCVDEVLDVLGRHDPDAAERIEGLFGHGARKWSVRGGVVAPQDEMLTVLCEAVAVLARRVDELTEANRPRRRGRPHKEEQTG